MYIYKITNNLNNKIYIGLKTKTVEESKSYYGSGVAIRAAIKEYGKDNFTKTILERDITDYDYLCERERHYIEYYDSLNNGYNLTKGGAGTLGHTHTKESKIKISELAKGRPLSEEHKKAVSEGLKGRIHSEETKRKISEGQTGTKRGPLSEEHKKQLSKKLKGKTRSEETKRKMSKSFKGRIVTKETKRKIKETMKNQPIRKCPHCEVKGKSTNMTRYHFNNCKQKPQTLYNIHSLL